MVDLPTLIKESTFLSFLREKTKIDLRIENEWITVLKAYTRTVEMIISKSSKCQKLLWHCQKVPKEKFSVNELL